MLLFRGLLELTPPEGTAVWLMLGACMLAVPVYALLRKKKKKK